MKHSISFLFLLWIGGLQAGGFSATTSVKIIPLYNKFISPIAYHKKSICFSGMLAKQQLQFALWSMAMRHGKIKDYPQLSEVRIKTNLATTAIGINISKKHPDYPMDFDIICSKDQLFAQPYEVTLKAAKHLKEGDLLECIWGSRGMAKPIHSIETIFNPCGIELYQIISGTPQLMLISKHGAVCLNRIKQL